MKKLNQLTLTTIAFTAVSILNLEAAIVNSGSVRAGSVTPKKTPTLESMCAQQQCIHHCKDPQNIYQQLACLAILPFCGTPNYNDPASGGSAADRARSCEDRNPLVLVGVVATDKE